MLTYHYDNVMYGRAAAPGAMVAQNSDYTQKPYREGDDVSASESFAAVCHPESQDSVANRVLLKPATQLSNVTVHDLYAHYPDFFIDIPREQALLREHEVIVFQHPLYTYSCPALLKEGWTGY